MAGCWTDMLWKKQKRFLKWLAKCTLQLSVDVKEIKKVLKIGYLSLLLQRGIYEKEFSSFGVLWQLNKTVWYLWQTASRWNWYAMTFYEKRANTVNVSWDTFIKYLCHDLLCQIMILPYSHSLSVKSVARNGYGYIRTMQRWKSCGLWQKPLNCLERFYRKGVCVIDNAVKTIQKKNNKCGIGNRGKTKIVVKEHFSEKGKTMEELLTDVMLEKAKQTIA